MNDQSNEMPRHFLGNTKLLVSALGLGTVALGIDYGIAQSSQERHPTRAEAERLIGVALDSGITLIDTAPGYGPSEEIIGNTLLGRRPFMVLATKVSCHDATGQRLAISELRAHIARSVESSLRRLRTDWIDLLQIHNWDPALGGSAELFAVFDELRHKGQVGYVGASVYEPDVALAALETRMFSVLQVAYNILDQRMQENVFPRARADGVGIIVRSILLKGVLTPRGEFLPPHLALLRERSRAFRALCQQNLPHTLFTEIAIAFGLQNPMIDAVLVGISSEQELAQALQALRVKELPHTFWEQLNTLKLSDPFLLNPANWGIP